MTCNVATVTINVEDANDNRPVLPEYDFGKGQVATQYNTIQYNTIQFLCVHTHLYVPLSGVNQSAVVDTVIGQVVVST